MKSLFLLLLAGCLLVPTADAADAAARRPNVLFLFSDDQRADTIGALGNSNITTPNLDRLVAAGTTLTRAYCMGAQQGAVCVPSRAMLMTGRTLFRIKENLAGQATWPQKFAAAGYRTFITGKWHNQASSLVRVFQSGQSIFLGGMGDPYSLEIQDLDAGQLVNKRMTPGHSVQVFADSAIGFIKAQKSDQPFLCYLAFNAPHDPRIAPPAFHEKSNAHKPPLPANFLPQHPFNNGELIVRDEQLAPWPRSPEGVRQHLADYYAAITFLDQQIGRILDALKASGQADNTIVVFSSDHGLAIGSHGLFGKQNLYDHSMHAPLIFAGPGIPRDQRRDALCYLLDIYPTLGEFAAVTAPEGSEGKSLVSVIAGKSPGIRDHILTAYTKVQRAVREDRWKLIVYPQINKTQLFDLQNDPNEMKDLASDKAYADQVIRLTRLLKDGQQNLGDIQPLRSDNPAPMEFDFSTVKAVKK